MTLKLYMDVHVRAAVTDGLRIRGVDVVTAQEDNAAKFDDPELLDRAAEMGRVLFSQDDDLLKVASRRQAAGEDFSGVIYAHQLRITIGQAVNDLELICECYELEDVTGRVEYLPL
ncbi:MAG: DUF5615 family PIN-like protein [Planctomycetaceae bacterium]